jgi:hypothetical protein
MTFTTSDVAQKRVFKKHSTTCAVHLLTTVEVRSVILSYLHSVTYIDVYIHT